MVNATEHDDLLFAMLKECKTLPVFLDHIFGFLNRRTDFYHVTTDQGSPVGLPPGLAEQIVKQTFYKWKSSDKHENSEKLLTSLEMNPPISTQNSQEIGDKFTPSECYNGATYDNYSWSQSINEVDIIIRIPDNITTKDLTVTISPCKISLKLKDSTILLEGEFCEKCKHNEAIWSLQKNCIDIHLDKCKESWWNCLIKTEPKLDVSTLDCSRPFEELSDEAQAKIEELQWNQERRRCGLPTSDELAILKKSWNCKGSPFSGPFDHSAVKFS